MTASMLHNVLQVVLLTISHAAAWGCTAAPHTAASNAGFGKLATSTITSTCMTHLLLLQGREKKPGGSHEENTQGHAGRALFSKRLNKEACSTKAQWHAAHMSMHSSVAGLPVASEVFKHAQ